MPHLTGMELAGLLPPDTRIVFNTAYAEYAAESYAFRTIDYLLKPITLKRFLAARQKIEAALRAPTTGTGSAAPLNDYYFFVKSGRILRQVLLDEVLYFEGERE